MCWNIRYDREFWKLFDFWGELNKALEDLVLKARRWHYSWANKIATYFVNKIFLHIW